MSSENEKVFRSAKGRKEIIEFNSLMSNEEPRINNRLRQCRKALRYTQKDVAYIMDVRPEVISKWEREISYPNLKNLLKLSYVYNRLMDYLYYDLGRTISPEIKKRRTELFPPHE